MTAMMTGLNTTKTTAIGSSIPRSSSHLWRTAPEPERGSPMWKLLRRSEAWKREVATVAGARLQPQVSLLMHETLLKQVSGGCGRLGTVFSRLLRQ